MGLIEVNSRDAILRTIEEFDRLGRSEFLSRYGYGRSQTYFLEHEGKHYDSKAIVGVAHQYCGTGLAPLKPEDFSGGASTVQQKLESLGFTVIRESVNPDWGESELSAIVIDYLAMLRDELEGKPYNKTDHRNALAPKLRERSKASIEFKHANISSALVELGLPYIDGYKPREHAQAAVAEVLVAFLDQDSELQELLKTKAIAVNAPNALEEVSPPVGVQPSSKEPKPRRAVRIDFQRLEQQNRKLGLAGEKLVVKYEREQLIAKGREDLANRVEHVAETQGDGLGYDVLSFDAENGKELFIEVKTTNGKREAPFLVTRNEVAFSEENPKQFALYRVFDFSSNARFYVRRGSLKDFFRLTEKVYSASPISLE